MHIKHHSTLFLIVTLIVMGLPQPVYAASIHYVTPTGSGDCSSWANACNLTTALNSASSGDEIWVATGTYKPGAANMRSATFTLKNGVAIYGGFAGTENQRSARDWKANPTILSGDLDGDGTRSNQDAYTVVTCNGADASMVLDGFTITGGNANAIPYVNGGGLWNRPDTSNQFQPSSPTLTNIIFTNNAANASGGGMYNRTGNPKLTNVVFQGNLASTGGGMYNHYNSSPELTNVIFADNTATNKGAGIYNNYSSPTLTNITFSRNTATYFGGGIYNEGWSGQGSSPTLTNVILWGNTAASSSRQVYNDLFSTATVRFSIVQGGYEGQGNLDTDPLFVDMNGSSIDGLRLQHNSPAIDAGSNSAVPTGITTDIAGNARFINHPYDDSGAGIPPIVDMGAYETKPDSYPYFLPAITR